MTPIDYMDGHRARVDVEFAFSAAHQLPKHPGNCARLHGHNYKLIVGIEGEVDPSTGMIVDFYDVQKIVQELVMTRVDHRHLNDLLAIPTAENIARWIWETVAPKVPRLAEVRLFETPDCSVVYRGQAAR